MNVDYKINVHFADVNVQLSRPQTYHALNQWIIGPVKTNTECCAHIMVVCVCVKEKEKEEEEYSCIK